MEDDADPRSRWRWLALPLVPFVALWDAFRGLLRTWGEAGERALNRLDPAFVRFTGVMVRFGQRVRPAIERIGAALSWVWAKVGPRVEGVQRAFQRIGEGWARLKAKVRAPFAPAWAAARRALRTATAPIRAVGRAVRGVWRGAKARVRGILQSIRSSLRRSRS